MLLKRGILSWFTHPHVILLGKYHLKFEHQENHFIYMLNVIATLSNVIDNFHLQRFLEQNWNWPVILSRFSF